MGSSGIVGWHNEFIAEENGIVVGRKGNAGKVIWMDDAFFPIDTTFYIRSKVSNTRNYYNYFLLKSLNLVNLNSDSAVPGLNRTEALRQHVFLPHVNTIIRFNDDVTPLFEQQKINRKQLRTLSTMRDNLLPKLMSGELDISHLNADLAYSPVDVAETEMTS